MGAFASRLGFPETAEARPAPRQQKREEILAEKQEFNRTEWEDCKRILNDSRIRENIKILEEQLGDQAKPLVSKAKQDLMLFDQLIEAERNGVDISQGDNRDLVIAALQDFHLMYDPATFEKVGRASMEHVKQTKPGIINFEKIPGIGTLVDRNRLESEINPAWLYGNTSVLEYVDEDLPGRTTTFAASASNQGLDGIFYRSGGENIKIYRSNAAPDFDKFIQLIEHELSHHHDWQNSNVLTLPERIQFLCDILQRLQSPDRVPSPYVDKIIPEEYKDLTPEQIRYIQAKEYWAEISSVHDQLYFSPKYKADSAIVEKWRNIILSRYQTK